MRRGWTRGKEKKDREREREAGNQIEDVQKKSRGAKENR